MAEHEQGEKWSGPVTDTVTVADELEYDALPERTRLLVERVCRQRFGAEPDDLQEAYDDGKEDGKKEGREAAEKEYRERITQLTRGHEELTAKAGLLERTIEERDEQLRAARVHVDQLNADIRRLRRQSA